MRAWVSTEDVGAWHPPKFWTSPLAPADFEVFNTKWHPQSSFYVISGTLSFKFLTQALFILLEFFYSEKSWHEILNNGTVTATINGLILGYVIELNRSCSCSNQSKISRGSIKMLLLKVVSVCYKNKTTGEASVTTNLNDIKKLSWFCEIPIKMRDSKKGKYKIFIWAYE